MRTETWRTVCWSPVRTRLMELSVSPQQPYSAASFARAWYSPTSYSGAIRLRGIVLDSFVALAGQRFKARRRRDNEAGAILLVHHAEEKNMLFAHPSRRQILRSTLASSGLGLAIGYPALTFAESAAVKQLSDRRRGHISNGVRRNALISSSATPKGLRRWTTEPKDWNRIIGCHLV
jgi:hypothetical protein